MNNLNKAAVMLLVETDENESGDELLTDMRRLYDSRNGDKDFGPLYQIGPKYRIADRDWRQIQTFAGSFIFRVVIDVKNNVFKRSIVFMFNDEDGFRMLAPDGSEKPVDKGALRLLTEK